MPSPAPFPEPSPALLVEALEPRIAPAALIDAAVPNSITAVTVGTPQLLIANQAGQPSTLSTSNVGGAYLLHVDAGAALVFTTDANGNGQFEFNEITGVALSAGARITLFTDVHGDIATNLDATGSGSFQLTDSDNNAANGRDGLRLLPGSVPNITLRSVTNADLNPSVPGETALNRIALSGYSIFGNIYVGGDLGVPGGGGGSPGAVNGLVIDTTGAALQVAKFTGAVGVQYFPGLTTPPSVGAVKTGTATSFQHLSFGNSFGAADITGELTAFTQAPNTHGGDIFGVRSPNNAPFSVNVIAAGDGGTGVGAQGGHGGNVSGVTFNGERGGYQVLAGNGGAGVSGGVGGSISAFSDLGSVTSLALLHSGDGGRGTLGAGGVAGTVNLGTVATVANLRVILGDGGDGLTLGGDGASQPQATVTPPESDVSLGIKVLSTTRDSFTFIDAPTGLPTATPQPGDRLATVLDPTTGQRVAVRAYDIGATRSVDFDGDGFSDALYTSSTPDQLVLVFGKDPAAVRVNPNDAPAQLNQRFGPGTAIDPSKTIFLDAPANPQGVVIADFNADGRPDVAVAGGDAGNFGGVRVYLNQIGDPVHNPINAPAFTGSPLGDHPFSDALHSNIPTLGGIAGADRNYVQSPVAIRNLVAGDFNGDGVLDLAYLGVYRTVTTAGISSQAVTAVLFGDTDSNRAYGNTHVTDQGTSYGHTFGNGYFYANPALPTDSPASRVQFSRSPGTSSPLAPQLIATSLVSDIPGASLRSNQPAPPGTFNVGQHDSLFVATAGARSVTEFAVILNQGAAVAQGGTIVTGPQAGLPAPSTALAHQPFTAGLTSELGANPAPDPDDTPDPADADPTTAGTARVALGRVDTNRDLATATATNLTLVAFTLADFTVLDYNRDGRADLVALSEAPAQFLVDLAGTKATPTPVATVPGSFNFTDNASPFTDTRDNRGISIGLSNNGRALRPTDDAGTSTPSALAIFTLGSNNTATVREGAFAATPTPANAPSGTPSASFFGFGSPASPVTTLGLGTFGADRTVISFDVFRSLSGPGLGVTGYQTLSPSQGDVRGDFLDFSFRGGVVLPTEIRITANGVEARSGDGGDALSGTGGKGGLIGGALNPTTTNPTGSVTVILPAYQAYRGAVSLRGGAGGDGFTGAGNGGDITGSVVRYAGAPTVLTSDAQIIAGAGGFAAGGTGGRGGDIAQVTVASGSRFQGGDGGGGLNGNRGGNIVGNTLGVPDATTTSIAAVAGNGGVGRINGGLGGSITNFRSQFLNVIGGVGGSLNYVAGSGGSGGGGTGEIGRAHV